MSKSDRLKLTTTSVRSLTPGEVDQVAGGDGGPTGNTSLSNAYCGPCPSNNPCASNNCPPAPTNDCVATNTCVSDVSCNGCLPPWATKGWCIR